jgi:hypothetical protein
MFFTTNSSSVTSAPRETVGKGGAQGGIALCF